MWTPREAIPWPGDPIVNWVVSLREAREGDDVERVDKLLHTQMQPGPGMPDIDDGFPVRNPLDVQDAMIESVKAMAAYHGFHEYDQSAVNALARAVSTQMEGLIGHIRINCYNIEIATRRCDYMNAAVVTLLNSWRFTVKRNNGLRGLIEWYDDTFRKPAIRAENSAREWLEWMRQPEETRGAFVEPVVELDEEEEEEKKKKEEALKEKMEKKEKEKEEEKAVKEVKAIEQKKEQLQSKIAEEGKSREVIDDFAEVDENNIFFREEVQDRAEKGKEEEVKEEEVDVINTIYESAKQNPRLYEADIAHGVLPKADHRSGGRSSLKQRQSEAFVGEGYGREEYDEEDQKYYGEVTQEQLEAFQAKIERERQEMMDEMISLADSTDPRAKVRVLHLHRQLERKMDAELQPEKREQLLQEFLRSQPRIPRQPRPSAPAAKVVSRRGNIVEEEFNMYDEGEGGLEEGEIGEEEEEVECQSDTEQRRVFMENVKKFRLQTMAEIERLEKSGDPRAKKRITELQLQLLQQYEAEQQMLQQMKHDNIEEEEYEDEQMEEAYPEVDEEEEEEDEETVLARNMGGQMLAQIELQREETMEEIRRLDGSDDPEDLAQLQQLQRKLAAQFNAEAKLVLQLQTRPRAARRQEYDEEEEEDQGDQGDQVYDDEGLLKMEGTHYPTSDDIDQAERELANFECKEDAEEQEDAAGDDNASRGQ